MVPPLIVLIHNPGILVAAPAGSILILFLDGSGGFLNYDSDRRRWEQREAALEVNIWSLGSLFRFIAILSAAAKTRLGLRLELSVNSEPGKVEVRR
ncbi:hypothetical protein DEU56DRAFT_555458 [Suillus clintonianus]|uniref:uncharacterized protein n=1 Tax=Suillus clintonianus TaxID=1904413 RepID=UPI001B8795B5|nr:uncharacterized protein DEU56DRAFT_555458 [Suillus clintonianus]KAG2151538.1 hypothetical protein DEU56DRAFT_555458 [Suillus clintonianus]